MRRSGPWCVRPAWSLDERGGATPREAHERRVDTTVGGKNDAPLQNREAWEDREGPLPQVGARSCRGVTFAALTAAGSTTWCAPHRSHTSSAATIEER